MSNAPLMPKATAVWLVDNTALSFDQVADFTKMHPLEIRAIADGDAAQGIKGMDPISTGQLSRDEIEKGEKDPNYRLKLGESKVTLPPQAKKKGPRYTPVSRRQDRPDAIAWFLRNHPEITDGQIVKILGTTKSTSFGARCDYRPCPNHLHPRLNVSTGAFRPWDRGPTANLGALRGSRGVHGHPRVR